MYLVSFKQKHKLVSKSLGDLNIIYRLITISSKVKKIIFDETGI